MSRAAIQRLTSIGVLVALAALWQLASILIPYESVPGEPMVPGWQIVVTRTFLESRRLLAGRVGRPGGRARRRANLRRGGARHPEQLLGHQPASVRRPGARRGGRLDLRGWRSHGRNGRGGSWRCRGRSCAPFR